MKTTDIKGDAIIIHRLIGRNTENEKTFCNDFNDINEALNACIRMMSVTPETVVFDILCIVKPPHKKGYIIWSASIPREMLPL